VHLISWRVNNDSFDVALAVNRLLKAGEAVWWLTEAGDGVEAGDYLVERSRGARDILSACDVATRAFAVDLPKSAVRLAAPRVTLFTGEATGYPYYAYYSLCLLRLGLSYVPVDGKAIAGGALDSADIFIIPGGFATWGLDAAEDAPGADAAMRRFLERGGGAIGSCGGAFYLSAGRPGWTGTANAKPRFTHEYLKSGVGLVNVVLEKGRLSLGLPPTLEIPYYHGPLYDELGEGIAVAGRFRDLVMAGRIGIDNPLDDDKFARTMAGQPAILRADGVRGRAVLFSPHPEMGDLLRKYTALDGYVRQYLPIRGFPVLRDTMRHYRTCDSPSFRLVLNAIHDLSAGQTMVNAAETRAPMPAIEASVIAAKLQQRLDALPAAEAPLQEIVDDVVSRLRIGVATAAPRVDRVRAESDLAQVWTHLAGAIDRNASANTVRPLAQDLMEIDLAAGLMDVWARLAELETAKVGQE
jgi:hypothetical protein